jgi:hypothetical protein
MADVLPGYSWDSQQQRYRNLATGRYVSRKEVIKLLEAQVSDAERRLNELGTAFFEGAIAFAVWVEQMRTEIRRLQIQQVALAKGGFDQLDSPDYGRVDGSLRNQYPKIIGTAQDVKENKITLPQLLVRIAGYVGVGLMLYHQTRRANPPTGNTDTTTIARRRLDPQAQHCEQCPQYYDLGWVMAGEVVAPGEDCQCGSHCRCSVDYRDVPTSELSQWLGTKN